MSTEEQAALEDKKASEEEPFDYSKFAEILEGFPKERRFLIPMLQKIQEAYRYIPEEALLMAMEEIGISRAQAYGVISFYPGLMITEPGKYILKVCVGTACFVKGSEIICQKVNEKFQIGVGETDETKLFTLQTASCMGNCGAAPMMTVNEDFYGNVEPEEALATLGQYKHDD